MTRIIEHTPAWLSRPSPGFQVFQQPAPSASARAGLSNGQGKTLEYRGAVRTIANRGTEIFFASGNQIKWADLVALKETGNSPEPADFPPQHCKIRQLVLSPLGDYLAIATSHTVHVAILPTSFDTHASDVVKLRTFQLGPTAHVLEQAPVVSLLWHPLGSVGSCLVTVAADACVRLWELNPDSRYSFDEPALALDLKKLANAASTGEDLRASVYGISKGFSPDSVEMEVAAAAFGGAGCPTEYGWSPMTLWIAMTEGDIYALCPFLPGKWQPARSTIDSLLTDVIAKAAILDDDGDASESDCHNAVRQQEWLSNVDAQDPAIVNLPGSYESVEVYTRPGSAASIPRLQGPFRVTPEVDLDGVADLLVIAPCDPAGRDFGDANQDSQVCAELSVGLVCLLTRTGQVHVCLDINGVEAQWLPPKRTPFQKAFAPEAKVTDLILLETIETGARDSSNTEHPSFTPLISTRYVAGEPLYRTHPAGRYQFMVTSAAGTVSCSMTPWLNDLEDELCGPPDGGSHFRAGLLYDSEKSRVEQIVSVPGNATGDHHGPASACITLLDSDLNHFVLSVVNGQPYAASLELPIRTEPEPFAPDDTRLQLTGIEPREAYQAHPLFFAQSTLPHFIESLTQSGGTRLKRADMRNQVRLSPATLHLLTEAHRVLSTETSKLGIAAADLFRRCQRMQAELAEQISRVSELASRAESVVGSDPADGGKQKLDARMGRASDRARQLKQRADDLRKRIGGLGGKELSKREEAWAAEVDALHQGLDTDGPDDGIRGSTARRFEAVRRLGRDVISQANRAGKMVGGNDADQSAGAETAGEQDDTAAGRGSAYGRDIRKQKLQHVMALLERETALVDAVTDRLQRLTGLTG